MVVIESVTVSFHSRTMNTGRQPVIYTMKTTFICTDTSSNAYYLDANVWQVLYACALQFL